MGSLKGKKKIHVSSTTYNLAGPEDKRNNFLKNTILGIISSPRDLYIGENLTRTYLNGPGITFRNFSRWAIDSGYTHNVVRQTGGTITLPARVDHNIIAQYINPSDPSRVMISLAELGIAEYNYWAMQYMLENHVEMAEGDWASSFDDNTQEVIIHFYNESGEETAQHRFLPVGYVKDARYVYATYSMSQEGTEGEIEEGPTIIHGTSPPPSTSGWQNTGTVTRNTEYEIPTTIAITVEYSDGTPTEYSESTIPQITTRNEVDTSWEKSTYLGSMPDSDSLGSEKQYLYIFQEYEVKETTTESVVVDDLGGGVIRTTTTNTTTRYVELKNSSRIDYQINILKGWSPAKIMIYRENTGSSAMDSQFTTPVSIGEFFPFIPVRLWNTFVSTNNYSSLYTHGKKALRKSTGAKLDKVIETLADNPSLKDIDHAFINFGVALNAKDQSSRRYIYEFFQQQLAAHVGFEYNEWESSYIDAQEKQAIWREWRLAQSDPNSPLFGTEEPEYVEIPYAPAMSVRISSNHSSIDYDMTMSWSSMSEQFFSGVFKPGAIRGQIDIVNGTPYGDNLYIYLQNGQTQQIQVDWRDPISITWQHEKNAYRRLIIRGLHHRNIVYKGKSVNISGRDALNDTDESGFIVPLHTQLYRSMPLVHSTQMSQACAYMVLNSWQVTKQKWYQTSAFKIILTIVIIVITVTTAGTGAAGAGVLGTNASVGAAIGFTGTAAIVAGAIANAVAAMVIAQIITAGATALLGDKWGAIIGTIASIFVISMGTSASTGNGWAMDYNQFTKADNLLRLTDSIGKGVAADIQNKAMKKFEETEAIIADYEEQSKRIAELYQKNIGEGTGVDLLAIQEMASKFDFNQEAPVDFLTRTLMTGTDIAELSQSLIDDFASITTSLNLS